jgi:hypothetical protein
VRVTPDLQIVSTVPVKADTGLSREPDIVFGDENYLVVWSDGTFGGEHKVQAARVTTEGVVLDSGIIFGMGAYCEYRPAVSFDGQRLFAVWYNYSDTPAGVFGRFINNDCQPEGHEIAIRIMSSSVPMNPDIAFGDSSYLVVWHEPSPYYDDDIYGQLVSTNGILIGDVIPIANDPSYQYLPRVCAGDSQYLVVWNQNCTIYGQWLSMSGELVGTNFPISDTSSCTRDFPAAAVGSTECLVAWHQFNNGNYDIFGNLDTELGANETQEPLKLHDDLGATIINGPLRLPGTSGYRVLHVAGRVVDPLAISPGIYFIECDGILVKKIIKVH